MLDNPQSRNVRISELDGQQQKWIVLAIKVDVIHGKQVGKFINLKLFCLGRSIDRLEKLANISFSALWAFRHGSHPGAQVHVRAWLSQVPIDTANNARPHTDNRGFGGWRSTGLEGLLRARVEGRT